MGTVTPDGASQSAQHAAYGLPESDKLTRNADSTEIQTSGNISRALEKDALIGVPISESGIPGNERGSSATVSGSVMHEEAKKDVQANWPSLAFPDEELAAQAEFQSLLEGFIPSRGSDAIGKTPEEDDTYAMKEHDELQDLFTSKSQAPEIDLG